MNKIKKILLALDYDPSEQKIAQISFSVAKAMNDKVILLHLVSSPMDYFTNEHFLKIGNCGFADPEPIQPHHAGKEKKLLRIFLFSENKKGDLSLGNVRMM